MKKIIPLSGGLIALYLIVAHGANFKTAAGGAGSAASGVIKTLQGR